MSRKRGQRMWSSEKVVELRKRYGETQENFARRLRVSIDTLQNWEQDRVTVPPPICKLLDYVEGDLEREPVPA